MIPMGDGVGFTYLVEFAGRAKEKTNYPANNDSTKTLAFLASAKV